MQPVVQGLIDKDPKLWYEFYNSYKMAIKLWVRPYSYQTLRRCGGMADIEDFEQEAWALIWQRLKETKPEDVKDGASLSTWLRKTAEWAAGHYADYLSKGGEYDALHLPYDKTEDESATKSTPESITSNNEEADGIERVLKTVAPFSVAIFNAHLMGETYEDLSKRYELPVYRLKMIVYRVRLKLQREVG